MLQEPIARLQSWFGPCALQTVTSTVRPRIHTVSLRPLRRSARSWIGPATYKAYPHIRTAALREDLASEAERFVRDIENQQDTADGSLEAQYEMLRNQVSLKWGLLDHGFKQITGTSGHCHACRLRCACDILRGFT